MSANLDHTRHSLSHLLAAAVLTHYPDAKLTLGPAIDDGFYYDIKFSSALSVDDLPKIETTMRELLPTWTSVTSREISKEEALKQFEGNEFKAELIEEIAGRDEPITLYTMGTFTDLCRGGHRDDLSMIDPQSFKLDRIAGAYWRGKEANPMLTRIYGLAFETKEKLKDYLNMREEAEKRDHRILGEKLDLFYFDEAIGKGLPIWLPNGNIIKEELERWAKETEEKWGYQRVTTPLITKENLFYTSGHLPLYKESMYAPIEIEGENYYLKPMNCPFHHRAFAARPKSYRDLPVRFAEYGWCHRYEDSGSLFGLMRVRGMQMNDAHIYVQKEKAVDEFVQVIKLHEYYYRTLGIENYEMELALRDPNKMDKYHGDEVDWKEAEEMTIRGNGALRCSVQDCPRRRRILWAEDGFPNLLFHRTSIHRFHEPTRFVYGEKFELEYMDNDGERKVPAIIHRAPLGTHERFIGFLIEHFAGAFPTWLAPLQIAIVPVKESHTEAGETLHQELRAAGIRSALYSGSDSLGKRIHGAKKLLPPYVLVLGDKEIEANFYTIELRNGEKIEIPKMN